MVICQLAKEKYGVPKVIARVNDPRNQAHFDLLGISPTVCATSSIMALVEHEVPEHDLIHLLELRKENLEIVEVQIDRDSPSAGKRVESARAARGVAPDLGHARADRPRSRSARRCSRRATRCSRSSSPARRTSSAGSCSGPEQAFVLGGRLSFRGGQTARARRSRRARSRRVGRRGRGRPGGGGRGNDWPRFGWSVWRSSAPTFPTGITAASVTSLVRRQVQLDGTVDSSAIYLHAVQVGGAVHDVFFVTTTYGKTEAIDAASGAVLWRFTPPGYDSWAGSAQITTATPVADPGRQWIYAASPGGRIYKLSVADGHAAWNVAITLLPSREKIAASLNYYKGRVIATTGGYYGDTPPYQGHVAVIDAASGPPPARLELALLEPDGAARPLDLPDERLRHLGPRRRRDRPGERRHPRRDRQRALGRKDELGRLRAAPVAGRDKAPRQLHAVEHRRAQQLRRRPRLDVTGAARARAPSRRAARTGRSGC